MHELIVIGGPTASGKTGLAIAVAQQLQTQIISADSRQFYREMKIGNARPVPEELAAVPHHFIADRSLKQPLTAGRYGELATQRLLSLFRSHRRVVCVGGSGLYIRALCEGMDNFPPVTPAAKAEVNQLWQSGGLPALQQAVQQYDPDYFARVDRQNPRRLMRALEVCLAADRPYSSFLGQRPPRPWTNRYFMPLWPRETLYHRINLRVDRMLEQGLEAEARQLLPYRDLPVLRTVGYQEWWPYFEGEYERERAIELIKQNSRRYAKRQLSWFGRDGLYQPVASVDELMRSW